MTKSSNKKIIISSWQKWSPRSYLKEFYSTDVVPDEVETIKFICKNIKKIGNVKKILDFGCGPTLHHIFPIVPFTSEIHLADYLPENLQEINRWVKKDPTSHDWSKYIKYTLTCEGLKKPSKLAIERRENMTRKKVASLLHCDASSKYSLYNRIKYPLVLACYCADSATSDKKTWNKYMHNIANLVDTNGTIIIAALWKAKYYKTGNNYFPSANITKTDLHRVLELDFNKKSIIINLKRLPYHKKQGYSGILLATAQK